MRNPQTNKSGKSIIVWKRLWHWPSRARHEKRETIYIVSRIRPCDTLRASDYPGHRHPCSRSVITLYYLCRPNRYKHFASGLG
jgi:hypothetical protein